MDYFHTPVLLNEVLEYLKPQANQNFLDGTLGGGGHALAILNKTSPRGHLLGLDRDPLAITAASENLRQFSNRVTLIQDSYSNIKNIYGQRFNLQLHGILLDLGLSSAQISLDDQRGFSFQSNQVLDMRFGPDADLTASQIINEWPENKLIEIFKKLGEEPRAAAIARAIVKARAIKPVNTTLDLVTLINQVSSGKRGKIHPATKVFQALRIAVNGELEKLSLALPDLFSILPIGGRLAVISYHSLEDRIVKNFYKEKTTGCVCPKEFPECRCGHKPEGKILTKKPIEATEAEISANPRSRSAKLRVIEKI